MEQTNKKAILYARVSSREQEETGYSLDAQEKLLKEYAEKQFKVVKTYKISESAAGKQIRKTFSEMMGYIEKNNSLNNLWLRVCGTHLDYSAIEVRDAEIEILQSI